MQPKYLFGALLIAPILPLLYYQGLLIRARVPKLPEATGPGGVVAGSNNKKLNMIALGESTIAGVGVISHEEGFAGTLAKELANKLDAEVSWKVYARSGYTAGQVSEKLVTKIQETEADLIIIGLGGNDAFKLNGPAKWRTDIMRLISGLRMKFPDAPIVFTNMPPIKEFPAFTPLVKFSIGNLVEILGEELGRLIIDQPGVYYNGRVITLKDWKQRLGIDATDSAFFSDGVHPSKLTYQSWAKDMANYIVNKLSLCK